MQIKMTYTKAAITGWIVSSLAYTGLHTFAFLNSYSTTSFGEGVWIDTYTKAMPFIFYEVGILLLIFHVVLGACFTLVDKRRPRK